MFETKYTQSLTGLSNVNTNAIIRLISYKNNVFGFKYFHKYKDKQTRLSLPQRSIFHSGFKDRWFSVRALEDSKDSAIKLKDKFDSMGILQ